MIFPPPDSSDISDGTYIERSKIFGDTWRIIANRTLSIYYTDFFPSIVEDSSYIHIAYRNTIQNVIKLTNRFATTKGIHLKGKNKAVVSSNGVNTI